jgi:hypothetical protein
MKLSDLYKSYTEEELQYSEGDPAIRFRAFSPFFQNLHEGKVIYYEKFMCIARLDDLTITAERLSAKAVPVTPIARIGMPESMIQRYTTPKKPWNIGMQWSWMMLNGGGLGNPYVGWTIWPEVERVQAVEKLIASGNIEGIMKLTLYSEEDEE